jgi:acetylornithine/succinyldiaminopimelate/putrescine aminotransferase
MVANFEKIKIDYPNMVEAVSGSGLLNALHLNADVKAYGSTKSVEFLARRNGLGIIHGGKNALRYTPHFRITDAEVELIDELTRVSLDHYAYVHDMKVKL